MKCLTHKLAAAIFLFAFPLWAEGHNEMEKQTQKAHPVDDSRREKTPDDILWEVASKDPRVGITKGVRDPKVCKQAKKHSDWLAERKLTAELPSASIAHHGDEARSSALIGNLVGSRGFHANQFQEIVGEAFPSDNLEQAAKYCIDHWHRSSQHGPVLRDKTAKWSCLTMSRGKNPNNPRWYCVGLALYYR